MSNKRTPNEIEKDLKEIQKAASVATSMKDIQNATGISISKINTTLNKHPRISKRIKEQLNINKKNKMSAIKKQKESIIESEKKSKKENNNIKKVPLMTNKAKTNISGFVIDASITGLKDLKNIILKICLSKEKIILTSLTINELEKLQLINDFQGKNASYILSQAAENPETFKAILIDESFDIPDNCIIKFCADNKENITLLTSDKTMAINARMHSIDVHYLKQTRNSTYKLKTLISARKIGNNLILSNFRTSKTSRRLISKNVEYNDGIRSLNIGDDVFVSSIKLDYITFAHYRIVSLSETDNCELIYHKRFYDYENINVHKSEYLSFIEDFKKLHNL